MGRNVINLVDDFVQINGPESISKGFAGWEDEPIYMLYATDEDNLCCVQDDLRFGHLK